MRTSQFDGNHRHSVFRLTNWISFTERGWLSIIVSWPCVAQPIKSGQVAFLNRDAHVTTNVAETINAENVCLSVL
jgi:hypothetical protein